MLDLLMGIIGVGPDTDASKIGQLLGAAPMGAGMVKSGGTVLEQVATALSKRIKNPIKAYHGSPDRTLRIPDPRRAMEVPGTVSFTDNMDVAEQYQFPREYGEIIDAPRGRVIEANLHVSNPMEVDFGGDVGEAIRVGRLVEDAKAKGHDALVMRNVDDSVDSSGLLGTTTMVFDKSVIEFVKKYGIAAALGAGLIKSGDVAQLKEQGFQ